MSREGRAENQELSPYDQMPSEQLEEIIRADFWLSDDSTSDDERIDRILETIVQRDKERAQQDAPQFKPWEDLGSEPPFSESDTVVVPMARSNKKSPWIMLKRVSIIAAIFVCVLLGSISTAYALGIDVWGAIVRWTDSVFLVEAQVKQETDVNCYPEPLRNMAQKLAAHGIKEEVLPAYLPEGYELIEETYFSAEAYSSFYAAFSKEDLFLSINCTQYYSENYSSQYEKDDPDPYIYHINGTDYYVFTNYGTPVVCWRIDNLDCAIIGTPENEIEKIIESIQ